MERTPRLGLRPGFHRNSYAALLKISQEEERLGAVVGGRVMAEKTTAVSNVFGP